MPVERSAGIILFLKTNGGRKFLVLRASRSEEKPEFWDFPKGNLKKNEDGFTAAKRETKEETGILDLKIIPEFKETVNYFTRRKGISIPKYVVMFLAEVKNELVRLSWEHDKYLWVSAKEASDILTREEMKNLVLKADKFLEEYEKNEN